MKQLQTTEQMAQYLQVSTRTLATWRTEGLPHISITARSFRYDLNKVEDWLRDRGAAEEPIVLTDSPYPPVVNPIYTNAVATFPLSFEGHDGDYGDYSTMDISHYFGVRTDLWPRSLVDLDARITYGSDPNMWLDYEREAYLESLEKLKYLPRKLWLVQGSGFQKLRERVLDVIVKYMQGRVNATPNALRRSLAEWVAWEVGDREYRELDAYEKAKCECVVPRDIVREILLVLGTKRAGPSLSRRLQAGDPVSGHLHDNIFSTIYEGTPEDEAEDNGAAYRDEEHEDSPTVQEERKVHAATRNIEPINVDKLMAEDQAAK